MSGFLPKGGGYRELRVFKLATAIHDLTEMFVNKYIDRGSRTKDQMEQAARSGKQNIAEGSAASSTSKETEIKLTNVAKASLEELLLDYEDYIRQHYLQQWDKNNPRVIRQREYLQTEDFIARPTKFASRLTSEEYCNLLITLIHQTTFMLRRLIERQQQEFLETGGIKERMYKARLDYRNSQTSQTGQTGQTGRTSQTSQTKNEQR